MQHMLFISNLIHTPATSSALSAGLDLSSAVKVSSSILEAERQWHAYNTRLETAFSTTAVRAHLSAKGAGTLGHTLACCIAHCADNLVLTA